MRCPKCRAEKRNDSKFCGIIFPNPDKTHELAIRLRIL